jgi:DNA-binding transcriptional ArsR family regulator
MPRLPNMSLGEPSKASLRALAHPIRLRIMSLLTGAPMTAAEVARELDLTHANASYHLRNLLAGGLIFVESEEKIRGGVAKRYRYEVSRDRPHHVGKPPAGDEQLRAEFAAFANELIRRTRDANFPPSRKVLVDAELWVEPEKWAEISTRVAEALVELHQVAQPPRTPGTIRTSTTAALFEMESE